jgi:hypothetical protein
VVGITCRIAAGRLMLTAGVARVPTPRRRAVVLISLASRPRRDAGAAVRSWGRRWAVA